MNFEIIKLPPSLIFVATPLGRARDITLYALDVLASADLLVAEDTRVLRKLMEIHAIPLNGRQVLSHHDHNATRAVPAVLAALAEGKSVAYTSDAGTPVIADPGHSLAQHVRDAGFPVTMAPGPSAAAMALALSGQPSNAFSFFGFLPNAQAARRRSLQDLRAQKATLLFYESPKRLAATLADMAEVLGPQRPATVCRELTKKFEEVRADTLEALAQYYGAAPPKGEIVVVVGPDVQDGPSDTDLDEALREALRTMRIKDAANAVAGALNLPKRQVYQRALSLSEKT